MSLVQCGDDAFRFVAGSDATRPVAMEVWSPVPLSELPMPCPPPPPTPPGFLWDCFSKDRKDLVYISATRRVTAKSGEHVPGEGHHLYHSWNCQAMGRVAFCWLWGPAATPPPIRNSFISPSREGISIPASNQKELPRVFHCRCEAEGMWTMGSACGRH